MAKPPRRALARAVPLVLLLALLAPAARADAWPEECLDVRPNGAMHASADPECLLGTPLPVVPGMEASCRERETNPDANPEPCCEDPCCEDPQCCQDPGCCPDPMSCCGDPSCCPDPNHCCQDPSCCTHPSCCKEPGQPGCCQDPACCKDPACCNGDPMCAVRVGGQRIRHRVGQEVAGLGVCLDFGQDANGGPYANLDATRSCTGA